MARSREEARRPLSSSTLLTVAEAVREIGGRESEVRRWLVESELVRDHPRLGKRVLWGDVLKAWPEPGDEIPAPPQPAPRKLDRVPLGRVRG